MTIFGDHLLAAHLKPQDEQFESKSVFHLNDLLQNYSTEFVGQAGQAYENYFSNHRQKEQMAK
jgi:hypothetical protein